MQQAALMLVLATMVYTVSLDLRIADFRYVATHPVAVCVGLVAQFVDCPAPRCLRHSYSICRPPLKRQ